MNFFFWITDTTSLYTHPWNSKLCRWNQWLGSIVRFFQCFNILVLTYWNEKAYHEVPKNNVIFFNILQFSWIISTFERFFAQKFVVQWSHFTEVHSRAMHHKIPHKISHRTVYVSSLGTIGRKWFYTKNCSKMRVTRVKIA